MTKVEFLRAWIEHDVSYLQCVVERREQYNKEADEEIARVCKRIDELTEELKEAEKYPAD